MNLFDKAKEALGKDPEKTDQGIDKASEAAKGKFGDHADKIDQASGKAKEFLHKQGGGDQPPPGE